MISLSRRRFLRQSGKSCDIHGPCRPIYTFQTHTVSIPPEQTASQVVIQYDFTPNPFLLATRSLLELMSGPQVSIKTFLSAGTLSAHRIDVHDQLIRLSLSHYQQSTSVPRQFLQRIIPSTNPIAQKFRLYPPFERVGRFTFDFTAANPHPVVVYDPATVSLVIDNRITPILPKLKPWLKHHYLLAFSRTSALSILFVLLTAILIEKSQLEKKQHERVLEHDRHIAELKRQRDEQERKKHRDDF